MSDAVSSGRSVEGRLLSCSFVGKKSVFSEGVSTVTSPPRSGTKPQLVNSHGGVRHRTSYRSPYVSERGGLPRLMTFKAVPFGSTVSYLCLPYPIRAVPRANVAEGLSSFVFIENIAFCGPWPAAVLLSRERQ